MRLFWFTGSVSAPLNQIASPPPQLDPSPHQAMIEFRAPERSESPILSARLRSVPRISVQPSHTTSVGRPLPLAPSLMYIAELVAVVQFTVRFWNVTRVPPMTWMPSWWTSP